MIIPATDRSVCYGLPAKRRLPRWISPRLLWSKPSCGKIPCIKIGKCVRYDPRALAAWIESYLRVGSTTAGIRPGQWLVIVPPVVYCPTCPIRDRENRVGIPAGATR